jgi:hypothetical protein
MPVDVSETVVETGDPTPVEPTVVGGDMAVKSAAVEPAVPSAVEPAAVHSASVRCIGEI